MCANLTPPTARYRFASLVGWAVAHGSRKPCGRHATCRKSLSDPRRRCDWTSVCCNWSRNLCGWDFAALQYESGTAEQIEGMLIRLSINERKDHAQDPPRSHTGGFAHRPRLRQRQVRTKDLHA